MTLHEFLIDADDFYLRQQQFSKRFPTCEEKAFNTWTCCEIHQALDAQHRRLKKQGYILLEDRMNYVLSVNWWKKFLSEYQDIFAPDDLALCKKITRDQIY